MTDRSEMSLYRCISEIEPKSIILAVLSSVASGACTALLISFIGKQFISPEKFDSLSIVLFVILLVLSVVSSLYASKVLIDASSFQGYKMRLSLCSRILLTPFEKFEKIGFHRLIASLSEDLTAITSAIILVPVFITHLTRVLVCVFYLFWLSPVAIGFLFLIIVPAGYAQMYLHRIAKTKLRELHPIRDRRYGLYESLIYGFKELVLSRELRSDFYNGYLEPNAREFKTALRNSFMANQYAVSSGQSIYFFIVFCFLISSSSGYMETEVVAAFALIGLFIRGSVNALMAAVPTWMRANTAIEKINSLDLAEEHSSLLSSSSDLEYKEYGPTHLLLDNVGYNYVDENSENISSIGPINIECKSGEMIFITGGNGSGKTTLVKLITALYQPNEGSISLNGQIQTLENLEWYRSHFCSIYSDFRLIDELTQEFIAQQDSRIEDVVSTLGLGDKFIGPLENISAAHLSSGQKARLALLPLLLTDKPIVIFDEWAANQDPEFKKIFYHQILPALRTKNKLIMVITHDNRFFDVADRVVHLDDGLVVARPDKVGSTGERGGGR